MTAESRPFFIRKPGDQITVREPCHDRLGRDFEGFARQASHSIDVNEPLCIPRRVVEPTAESPNEGFKRPAACSRPSFGCRHADQGTDCRTSSASALTTNVRALCR